MSLAELQSVVSELECQLEGQKANIESLTSTLNTKEEIIAVSVHARARIHNRFFYAIKELIEMAGCFIISLCFVCVGATAAFGPERGEPAGCS